MGQIKKNLGLGNLIIASIFLFNPNMVVIDFLPDFIGYIFMILGLSQLADLNYYFENAIKGFRRMLIVSLAQFASIFILFGLVSPKEQGSTLMLFAFLFGTLEIIFLVPAFKSFFDGMIYIGSRYESTSIFYVKPTKPAKLKRKKDKPQRPSQNVTIKTMRLTVLFVVTKALITFAPEALAIFDTESGYNRVVNLYDFVELFRTCAIFILIPICVLWLYKFIKYIISIIKDENLIDLLTKKYTEEIAPKEFLFIQRYIRLAFIVLIIGIVFNIDFYIDNLSILPDFICPLILIVVYKIVRKFTRAPRLAYVFSIGYFITSLSTYILNFIYFSNFTLTIKEISQEASTLFTVLTVSKIIDSVFFILAIIPLLPIIKEVIEKNTGFAPVSSANYNADDKVKYVQAMLKKKLTVLFVLTILSGISSICYILFVSSFALMWLIEFTVLLTFTVYFGHTLNAIQEEIEYKYMLS